LINLVSSAEISSLASAFVKEEERWNNSLRINQELFKNLLGDIILASGYFCR
jgi:hypothetical protein